MKRHLRLLLYLSLSVSLMAAGLIIILQRIIEADRLRPRLERVFSDFLTRPLDIKTLGWKWFPLPSLVGYDVQLWSRDGRVMVNSPEVEIHFSYVPLVRKKIVIEDLIFLRPQVNLRRRTDGTFPIVDMVENIRDRLGRLKEQPPSGNLRTKLDVIDVRNARLEFIDETKMMEPLPLAVVWNGKGSLHRKKGETTFPFRLSAFLIDPAEGGRITARGVLGRNTDLHAESGDLSVRAAEFYVQNVAHWTGTFETAFDFQKSPAGSTWTFTAASDAIRPKKSGPFPRLLLSLHVPSRGEMRLNAKAETETSLLFLKTSKPSYSSKNLHVLVLSPYCDLAEAWSWREPLIRPSTTTLTDSFDVPASYTITGKGKFERLTFHGVSLRHVEFRASASSTGTLTVEPLEATGLGGRLIGRAEFRHPVRSSATPVAPSMLPPLYTVVWRAQGIKGENLSRLLFSKEWFSGIGDSDGILRGDLSQRGWAEVSGLIHVRIRDGAVWGIPGLKKSFSQLNVPSLYEGEKNTAGFSFDIAEATATIAGGKVAMDPPGVIESDTLKIGVMGEADLIQNTVDGKLVFYFLTVVEAVFKAVPGIKTILYGGRKSLVPVWVSVQGPMDDPRVEVLPVRSVSGTLSGTVESIFKLPFKLLQPLTGGPSTR